MQSTLGLMAVATLGFVMLGVSGVEHISNDWYVVLHGGNDPVHVAKRNGFNYMGPVMHSANEHHFRHEGLPVTRQRRSIPHTRQLKSDPAIRMAVQQVAYSRVKRGYKTASAGAPVGIAVDDSLMKAGVEMPKDALATDIRGRPVVDVSQTARFKYQLQKKPTDPLYQKEWYLKNTGQAGGTVDLDLNVEAAWAQGATGKGVTTAIMDDGIDYMHPDLADNFNFEASFDFSSNDPFPYPRYTDDWFNSHGTRCAGEIAAQRDNGLCGVGVAYNSKIAGLRMLDQPYMTDLIEANSMGYRPDLIDIYSASWGPTDDGKTVDGPRNLTMRAIVKGVNEGRRGLGNIYVWASGDGGPDDDCNCDGYAASMWTISINSATNDGQTAGYDESCSSTLASTFSNGKIGMKDAGVATTDLYGNCTLKHSGTSAAAPEAAGVFALALEANPDLTWRDVQHLTVMTSKRNHLYDPYKVHQWKINGAGLEFNHLFGYGVLDAGSMVEQARKWIRVPDRFHCNAGVVDGDYEFSDKKSLRLFINTDACMGTSSEVKYLEHVQAFITLKASRRGDVTIYLTSPMNTTTMILSQRPHDDDSQDGFVQWPFMTTHMWAENPRGLWTMEIRFHEREDAEQLGLFKEWTLFLHGSQLPPYEQQVVMRKNSKLDTVKRAHETNQLFTFPK